MVVMYAKCDWKLVYVWTINYEDKTTVVLCLVCIGLKLKITDRTKTRTAVFV